jgi:hypothetical protein
MIQSTNDHIENTTRYPSKGSCSLQGPFALTSFPVACLGGFPELGSDHELRGYALMSVCLNGSAGSIGFPSQEAAADAYETRTQLTVMFMEGAQ